MAFGPHFVLPFVTSRAVLACSDPLRLVAALVAAALSEREGKAACVAGCDDDQESTGSFRAGIPVENISVTKYTAK